MKHYLINTSVDWCDEFDMPFYELLYEVYQGREYGLDLLQFEPIEITDIEYSVIKNYLPVGTLDVMDDLLNYLEDRADLKDSEDIYKMTPEQVMKIIDAIAK